MHACLTNTGWREPGPLGRTKPAPANSRLKKLQLRHVPVDDFEIVIENPSDLREHQAILPRHQLATTGIQNGDIHDIRLVTRLQRWDSLLKLDEHVRLATAIMDATETMENPRHDKKRRSQTP
jgi:hypothetical protein